MIRENKSLGKHSEAQLTTLQTKYENLDTFYVTTEQMEDFREKLNKFESDMKQKIADIEEGLSIEEDDS